MPVDDLWYLRKRGPDGGERIPSRRYGRGKRYRARWVDDAGRTRTKLFERKVDAEREEANHRADLSRGQYIDPRAGRVTFEAYAEQWRAAQLYRDSTAHRMERGFRLHIYPVLGRVPIGQARPSNLQGWVKAKSTEMAASTLRLLFTNIASVFAAAIADRVIGVSPCAGVRLPDIERGDRFIPGPELVHALAAALPARYASLVYVAAGCGLRPGEVMGLELGHVDFLRREIRVEQQLLTIAGRAPYLAPPKTKTSRRTVELPEVVGAALAEHIRECPPAPVDVDDETDPRRPVRRAAKLLFTNANGLPIHRSNWSHQWTPAVKAAGLPARFGLHGLRHYYATLLIHSGASVKTVQLALGHSTPTITLNTYVHEWPEAVDRTRSLVDSALGRQPSLRARGAS